MLDTKAITLVESVKHNTKVVFHFVCYMKKTRHSEKQNLHLIALVAGYADFMPANLDEFLSTCSHF